MELTNKTEKWSMGSKLFVGKYKKCKCHIASTAVEIIGIITISTTVILVACVECIDKKAKEY